MRRLAVLPPLFLVCTCCPKPGSTTNQPKAGEPTAGIYVDDLDRTADPCTDFYEFANGTWRAQHPIPASQPRWSRRWESGELAKERLKDILDEVSAKTDWPAHSVEQLIGDFYGACMDEAKADQLGLTPVQPLLDKIAAIKDKAGLQAMIAELHTDAIRVPFATFASSDNHDPTDVVANFAASGLGLPDRDYYVKDDARFVEARDKYVVHVAAVFELAGASDADAAAHAATVMAFETRLAKASLDNIALRLPESTDHRMKLADVAKLAPSFDWAGYIKAMGLPEHAVNVTEPAFLQEFDHELTDTPLADWQVYLTWHVLASASPMLSHPFADEDFAFNEKYLSGVDEQKPRWKRCAEGADGLLGEALGQKYVEKYFPPEAKARVQELVRNELAAMKDSIESLTWMSEATKQKALEKLATFNPKIGYPDKWKDYSSITITRGALWDDVVAARRWNVADDLGTVGKPLDRGRWGMTPPTSDAYYNSSLNEIVFPAGILQAPGFRLDAVDAINYGSIGVVIGHEISHGFDDQGAKYDAQGRLENWWTPGDLTEFTKRGQCVIDQFDGYAVEPGINTQGKLVLGESIGDLGGLNIAYRAFQKAQHDHPAPTIDGFTPDQQFFIAWGQWRGDAVRPEMARLMVQGDPHPIGKFRVIGPMSNMSEFAKAFSCKADAPMVRANACIVW